MAKITLWEREALYLQGMCWGTACVLRLCGDSEIAPV